MARLLGLAVWLFLLFPAPGARADTGCTFVLGFAAMAANVPQVGRCLDGETHNPVNGDALQHTTGGLLVWRKLDNWTAFTDGARTWIAGPFGLQTRLNTQRFAWEATGAGAGTPLAGLVLVPNDGSGTAPGCHPDARNAVPIEAALADPAPYLGRCVQGSAYADGADMPAGLTDFAPPSDPVHFPLYFIEAGGPTILVLDLSAYPTAARIKTWLIHGAQHWPGGMSALVDGVLTQASGPVLSVRPVRIQGAGCTFAAPGYGPAAPC